MKDMYIGVDIGSVSVNVVAINRKSDVIFKSYMRNSGQPIDIVKEAFQNLHKELKNEYQVQGVGVTGSGRQLIGYMIGADVIKNEITAHAAATIHYYPEVSTIFEIGGQDSKFIQVKDGIVTDFAMNTVCAAGTGSFLDHQSERLGINIEDFGELALNAKRDVRIAGRCSVFAESDMISKQQFGYTKGEIIKGLCEALVRNYMNNLVRGKKLEPLFIFQGGVAANIGIKTAFEEEIDNEVIIPEHYDVMGAIGIASLTKAQMNQKNRETSFKGFHITQADFTTTSFMCNDCANNCEVVKAMANGETIAMTGDRCGKWSNSISNKTEVKTRNIL